jgi:hypothetical protein
LSCSNDNAPSQTEEIKLNDIQIIGSHNSYKRPLHPKILELIAKHDSKVAAHINYSHPSITNQLQLGLRHLEIDIVKDPDGGKFSHPKAEELTRQTILTAAERTELKTPGFKVMHIPDLDFSSHCILFQSCLDELVAFSNEQPNHLPLVVLMNLKESSSKLIDGTQLLAFNADDYADLDKVLLTTFGEKLITPNSVRGQYASLEQAVLNKGWPSLNDSRGRFLFILDGKSPQLDIYRSGHPSLSGRAMFASYPEGQPEAALMIRNNPLKNLEQIISLVEKGYLVRTRADGGAGSDTKTANVKLRAEKAFASGAQIISTDFYPGAPQELPSDYVVSFKQGMLYRCNQKVRKTPCKLKG